MMPPPTRTTRTHPLFPSPYLFRSKCTRADRPQSTGHRDTAGGHEAASSLRGEGRPRRNLRRFGHAPERIYRGEHLQAFLAYRGLRQFGRRRPGRQHVDPDASALQVLRPAPREVAYLGLARAVDAECRLAGGAGARSGKGYETAFAPSGPTTRLVGEWLVSTG